MSDWVCEYCLGVNPGSTYVCQNCGHPKTHLSAKLPRLQEAVHLVKDRLANPSGIDPTSEVILVDGSAWNGIADYSILKTKAMGILLRGVIGSRRDSGYTTNRDGALSNQFPYGMYAAPYISPGQSYSAQAEVVKNVLREQPYDIPLSLDLEKTYFPTQRETNAWCYGYVSEVRSKTGIDRGLMYSRKSWWDWWILPGNQSFWAFFEAWPAHWTTASVPLVMRDWNGVYRLHQFSGDNNGLSAEYGFSGGDPDIDLNRFNGTPLDYQAWLNNASVPPPDTGEIDPSKIVLVTASALNIRSLPTATSRDIGTLPYGADVPVMEERDGFYRIEGWISKNYTSDK